MTIYRMSRQAAFDDETVKAMATAYEAALDELKARAPTVSLTDTLARKIIELARRGERDPDRLCELALKDLRG